MVPLREKKNGSPTTGILHLNIGVARGTQMQNTTLYVISRVRAHREREWTLTIKLQNSFVLEFRFAFKRLTARWFQCRYIRLYFAR